MSALETFPPDARQLTAEILAAKAAYANATTRADQVKALALLAMLKASYRDGERAARGLP